MSQVEDQRMPQWFGADEKVFILGQGVVKIFIQRVGLVDLLAYLLPLSFGRPLVENRRPGVA